MQQLCVQANCSFWVDMELFRADMSNGLLPKDFPGVAQELVRALQATSDQQSDSCCSSVCLHDFLCAC